MKKSQLYSLIILSFCSSFLDFMILPEEEIVFPRDRILHIIISYAIFSLLICIVKNINFEKSFMKFVIIILIAFKIIVTIVNFTQYFQTYHGSNTLEILIFTAITAYIVYGFSDVKLSQLYSFFALGNIILILLMIILAVNKINVANIYSNSMEFSFSFSKTPLFFEIFTICLVTNRGEERIYTQRRYLFVTATIFMLIALLQGLCVKGNILYGVAPMQSLFQIYSGVTIRRFDYLLTVVQSVNYFAAVTLYVWAVKSVFYKETVVEKD